MSRLRNFIYWIGFALLWILVCVAGLLVDRVLFRGTFIAPGIVSFFESWIGTEGLAHRVSVILTSGILGLIDGLILGMFQWAAVRRLLKNAYGWILATSLGYSLGLMAFWSLMILVVSGLVPSGSNLEWAFGIGILDGVVTGVTLGFAQYLVLRRKVQDIQWWVPTMIVTMLVTWIVRWYVSPGASYFAFGIFSGIVMAVLGGFGEEGSYDLPSGDLRPTESPLPSGRLGS